MSTSLLDLAYIVEEPNGVARYRAVVAGGQSNGCQYPDSANAGGVLGITTHAQSRQNRSVTVRRMGIAQCELASAVARGQQVAVADDAGKIGPAATPSATTGVVGSNNALTWTLKRPFAGAISQGVRLVVAGNNTPLSVVMNATHLQVNVATNGGGAATSTAAQVLAAVQASAEASAFFDVAHASTSTGAGVVAGVNGDLPITLPGLNAIGIAEIAGVPGDVIPVLLTP